MAVCKHCGCDELRWQQDPDTERWTLLDSDNKRHRCLATAGPTRINPVYRMMDAMTPRELSATVAYALKILVDRTGTPVPGSPPPVPEPAPAAPELSLPTMSAPPAADSADTAMRERLHRQRDDMREKLKQAPSPLVASVAANVDAAPSAVDDENLPF